jgi:predicted outer membrane repeat protein
MRLFSWLRNSKHQRNGSGGSRRKPATFRPQLESLEDRWLPSTLMTVTNTLDDGYTSGSLRVEIAAAQSNDTIQFAIPTTDPGYNPATKVFTINLTYGEEIQIAKNLTIQGPGAGQLTINGGGSVGSRVFEVDGAATAVSLSGLSITGGNGVSYSPSTTANTGWSAGGNHTSGTVTVYDGQGGAIWNGGVLKISDCDLSDNSADLGLSGPSEYAGGAVYNANSLTVSNSVLSGNSAGDDYAWAGYIGSGGAIYNAGTLSVVGSALTHNAAHHHGSGGAIASAGTLSVSGGTISNNSASYGGGGIFSGALSGSKTTATVTGTTLSNSSASYGGAIYNDTALTLSGCYVDGNNSAAIAGGGIYNSKNGHLTIQSACNVTGNSAPVGADLEALGPVKISKDSTVGVIGS